MDTYEALDLIEDIRKAQKDEKTPIGAAYSLRQYLGRNFIATIGELLPNGDFAIYAQSEEKPIPDTWCGFKVINTKYNKT